MFQPIGKSAARVVEKLASHANHESVWPATHAVKRAIAAGRAPTMRDCADVLRESDEAENS